MDSLKSVFGFEEAASAALEPLAVRKAIQGPRLDIRAIGSSDPIFLKKGGYGDGWKVYLLPQSPISVVLTYAKWLICLALKVPYQKEPFCSSPCYIGDITYLNARSIQITVRDLSRKAHLEALKFRMQCSLGVYIEWRICDFESFYDLS